VDASGKITMPLVGEIAVAGKTTSEATSDITTALKKFLKNPQVTLEVAVPAKRNVAISGAVKTPGLYPVSPTTHLVDLLSVAGGSAQNADLAKVTVTRAETKQALICNLQEFYAGRNPEGNVLLGDGDSIMVPELGVVRSVSAHVGAIVILGARSQTEQATLQGRRPRYGTRAVRRGRRSVSAREQDSVRLSVLAVKIPFARFASSRQRIPAGSAGRPRES
jgi:hypothetical protein